MDSLEKLVNELRKVDSECPYVEFKRNNFDPVMIGEDICDPYGGSFKVTKGLSTKYPNRVFGTSISEYSIIGIGNGLSLSGMLPVCEIMFGDFMTLTLDQILISGY